MAQQDLVITRKFFNLTRGRFKVKDAANRNVLFSVKDKIFTLRDRRVIRDAAGDIVVLTLRQKIFSAHYTWRVYEGDSRNENDLLFRVKTNTIFQFNLQTILNVFLAENIPMVIRDYMVEMDSSEKSFVIWDRESNVVAQGSRGRRFFRGQDKFIVTVFGNTDNAFIVALIVILDDIVSNHGLRSRLGFIIRVCVRPSFFGLN